MRIQRQRESFAYRIAGGEPSIWGPEEKALAAELSERLQYKTESGELPQHNPDSPEHYTQALQEMIQMDKERAAHDDWDSLDLGYDPDFNDWEAGQKNAARRLAMPAPKNLNFQPHPDYPGGRAAQAFDDDKEIGRLSWDDKNTVEWITTHPDYRGHGVASQLFDWAKQNMVPDIQHSTQLTPSGAAFARSKGFQPPRDFFKQPPVDDAEDWPDAQTGQGAKWQGDRWNSEWLKRRIWEMGVEGAHRRIPQLQKSLQDALDSGKGNPSYLKSQIGELQQTLAHPDSAAYLKQYLSVPE
jgi:GNAT superfamily N-acetyltransferase